MVLGGSVVVPGPSGSATAPYSMLLPWGFIVIVVKFWKRRVEFKFRNIKIRKEQKLKKYIYKIEIVFGKKISLLERKIIIDLIVCIGLRCCGG